MTFSRRQNKHLKTPATWETSGSTSAVQNGMSCELSCDKSSESSVQEEVRNFRVRMKTSISLHPYLIPSEKNVFTFQIVGVHFNAGALPIILDAAFGFVAGAILELARASMLPGSTKSDYAELEAATVLHLEEYFQRELQQSLRTKNNLSCADINV